MPGFARRWHSPRTSAGTAASQTRRVRTPLTPHVYRRARFRANCGLVSSRDRRFRRRRSRAWASACSSGRPPSLRRLRLARLRRGRAFGTGAFSATWRRARSSPIGAARCRPDVSVLVLKPSRRISSSTVCALVDLDVDRARPEVLLAAENVGIDRLDRQHDALLGRSRRRRWSAAASRSSAARRSSTWRPGVDAVLLLPAARIAATMTIAATLAGDARDQRPARAHHRHARRCRHRGGHAVPRPS